MKNIYAVLLVSLSFCCYAQKQTTEKFLVASDTITYLKVAYPKYGIAQIFINMYEASDENNAIATNAIKCLNKEANIYHTLYYFIAIPKEYTISQREEAFTSLIKHLSVNEQIDGRTVLYLNFDKDYSKPYYNDTIRDAMLNKIQTTRINTTPNNICKRLHVDID